MQQPQTLLALTVFMQGHIGAVKEEYIALQGTLESQVICNEQLLCPRSVGARIMTGAY